uniref:Autophagy-related protein 27 n=2 Tax=Lotharella globosa TaxID=91324 RepID=A0A6V3M268_9EUKA|mmetsp:Transcript_34187/g.66583  ORF Transcript_34187/g.66583 Transcript_34187/m.66583 type:complete len:308 (+) Transcript_34187:50-973(+)|eukprot:CAMPEP_0167782640 /NCGR_PEP_ID=MMETSP0111_2-20121227/6632_1 /TAXON_ID=91324 /ORGANISM="Lotharella globosa, Strain CCCM811" /LENGTH=307 /DNA_ID=CAMNT_0007673499 /DNA_START=110 /DNA_END=1033 /DNA_ORIENTATION=+
MTPLLAPLLVATAGAISCQPSFKINPSNSGDAFVYYNLMSMNLRGASWTFGDSDHDSQSVRNYTYRIQICGEVESPSKIPACKDNLATATAWQFDSKGDRGECFRLGSHFDDGNAEWSMIDENEPGKGIQLTYFNGDFCPYHQKNRSLTVEIVCENRKTVPPAFVEERGECHYFITLPHQAGCPSTCEISAGQVCGDNGFCGFDTDTHTAKCFCDDGWSGKACSTKGDGESIKEEESPGCDGVCVALIFVFLLLLGLIATAVVLLLRVRKMNELNIRFAALGEELNPDGLGDETFELQDTTRDDIGG